MGIPRTIFYEYADDHVGADFDAFTDDHYVYYFPG